MNPAPKILVVDNYDSFVYNIVQYLGELGAEVVVRRNDEVGASDIESLDVDGVLISPGPGHPLSAGNCLEIINYCAQNRLPMLGVCLGHQALGQVLGAKVDRAPELLHGRKSVAQHDNRGVFAGVTPELEIGRYHSLVVVEETLPEELEVSARSNGLVMGIRHKSLPLEGVQFHPESVLTQDGYLILANWLSVCGSTTATSKARELTLRIDELRSALPSARS
jgi:para-aminobenzoate synthetase component II